MGAQQWFSCSQGIGYRRGTAVGVSCCQAHKRRVIAGRFSPPPLPAGRLMNLLGSTSLQAKTIAVCSILVWWGGGAVAPTQAAGGGGVRAAAFGRRRGLRKGGGIVAGDREPQGRVGLGGTTSQASNSCALRHRSKHAASLSPHSSLVSDIAYRVFVCCCWNFCEKQENPSLCRE